MKFVTVVAVSVTKTTAIINSRSTIVSIYTNPQNTLNTDICIGLVKNSITIHSGSHETKAKARDGFLPSEQQRQDRPRPPFSSVRLNE